MANPFGEKNIGPWEGQQVEYIPLDDLVLWTENPRDPLDGDYTNDDVIRRATDGRNDKQWQLSKLSKEMGDRFDLSELPRYAESMTDRSTGYTTATGVSFWRCSARPVSLLRASNNWCLRISQTPSPPIATRSGIRRQIPAGIGLRRRVGHRGFPGHERWLGRPRHVRALPDDHSERARLPVPGLRCQPYRAMRFPFPERNHQHHLLSG